VTDTQLLAFVIMPIAVVAIAGIGALIMRRIIR